MKRLLCLLLSLCALLLLCAGCAAPAAAPAEEGEGYTFTDALGQTVTVNDPQRVVSLMGSFSEMWVLAGGRDSLVGVSDDTFDGRDLGLSEEVAMVGQYQSPNVEAILALDPDLVLLSAETTRTDTHMALKDALSGAGITTAYFSVTHFEDYVKMMRTLCDITKNEAAFEESALSIQKEIDAVIAENKLDTAPSVLLLITYSGGIRAQNSSTMTGRMLKELGCHNIIDDDPSLLQDFSVESIISADPDYIFVIPMGNDDEATRKNLRESIEADPAWSSLTAVREGRYLLLEKNLFLYKPNARWAESYQKLAELLYE